MNEHELGLQEKRPGRVRIVGNGLGEGTVAEVLGEDGAWHYIAAAEMCVEMSANTTLIGVPVVRLACVYPLLQLDSLKK